MVVDVVNNRFDGFFRHRFMRELCSCDFSRDGSPYRRHSFAAVLIFFSVGNEIREHATFCISRQRDGPTGIRERSRIHAKTPKNSAKDSRGRRARYSPKV